MSKIDKQVDEMFETFCKIQYIEKDDYDDGCDDWEENWDAYVANVKQVISNFLTMPARKVFEYARKDGWVDKHIKRVQMVTLDD